MKSMPKEVKEQVLSIVDTFNEKHQTRFFMTFRGQFAYLKKRKQHIVEIPFSFIEPLVA